MAVDAGSTFVSVRIRLDQLKRDIAKTEAELKKLSGESANESKKFTNNWKVAFAGIALAGVAAFRKIASVTGALIKAASDAEETGSKFSVVFAGIEDDAAAAAQTLEDSFGQSSVGAKRLLGDVGDILTGLGFTSETALDLASSVAELGIDLASFTNFAGGADGATQALTKALLGEAESVKALGIVIRQDTQEYKALVEQLMETENVGLTQAKALAALQIATEQSKNSVGDFSRTQDQFANQTRIAKTNIEDLSAALGNDLLPAATDAVGVFNDLIEDIIETKERIDELLAASEAVAAGTATAAQKVTEYKRQLDALNVSLQRANDLGQGNTDVLESEISRIEDLISVQQRLAAQRVSEDAIRAGATKDKADADAAAAQAAADADEASKRRTEAILALAENEAATAEAFLETEALRRQALADRTNAETESFFIKQDLERQAQEQALTDIEELKKARQASASFTLGLAAGTFENVSKLFKKESKAKKAALIASSLAERAGSAFNAFVSTQEAAAKALTAGPILGPILSGIIQGLGGINIAAIIAKPLPSFAGGGVATPSAGGTNAILAENGSPELLLNAGTQGEALLGEFAARIAEAGGGGPDVIVIQSVLNGRIIAEDTVDLINRRENPVNESSIVASR